MLFCEVRCSQQCESLPSGLITMLLTRQGQAKVSKSDLGPNAGGSGDATAAVSIYIETQTVRKQKRIANVLSIYGNAVLRNSAIQKQC